MKIETRKVTVEQEVYIANDGQEFDNEDDCLSHERDLLKECIDFYDDELEDSDIHNCRYVKLDTPKSVRSLILICKLEGYPSQGLDEHKLGVYMYTDRLDRWIYLMGLIDQLSRGNTDVD